MSSDEPSGRDTLTGVRVGDLLPPAEGPSHSLFKSQTIFAGGLEATSDLEPGDAPILADESVQPRPGDMIGGRYRVVRRLGAGGMGRIFEVTHQRLGKTFALKCMTGSLFRDDDAKRSFYREARFASSLVHPQIPSVVDYGDDPTLGSFMVMDYVDGQTLRALLDRDGPPSLESGLEFALHVAEALHYVHQRQLVHGDIKAENVIVTVDHHDGRRRRVAKLVDFGLARTKARATEEIQGTLAYLAPERVHRQAPTPASDIYAFGVLAFYLISGRQPYVGSANEILSGHVRKMPPSMASVGAKDVPSDLENLVAGCLSKAPADRPASMADVIVELKRTLRNLGVARGSRLASTVGESSDCDEVAQATFEHFILPIGAVSSKGEIVAANGAFGRLVTGITTDTRGMLMTDTPLATLWAGLSDDIARAAAGEVIRRVIEDDSVSQSYLVWLEPSPLSGYVTIGAHPVVR